MKNIFACEHVTNSMANLKTVGVINRDDLNGITEIAEPVGVICGVTPVTNPTSTAIFKSLISLKTRNPIIFAFHPSAQASSVAAARVVRDAAVAAGAPEHCIQWVETPSIDATTRADEPPGRRDDPGHRRQRDGPGRVLVRQAGPRRRRGQRPRLHREDRQAQARGQRRRAVQGVRQRHDLRVRAGRDPRRRDLRRRAWPSSPCCTRTGRTPTEKALLEKFIFGVEAGGENCGGAKLNATVVGQSPAVDRRAGRLHGPRRTRRSSSPRSPASARTSR